MSFGLLIKKKKKKLRIKKIKIKQKAKYWEFFLLGQASFSQFQNPIQKLENFEATPKS